MDLCYGRHPSQWLRGVFYCPFGLKNCPFYEKSTFLSKNSGKNLRISKNVCTFALGKQKQLTIKNNYDNEN